MGAFRLTSPLSLSISVHLLIVALALELGSLRVRTPRPRQVTWVEVEATPSLRPQARESARHQVVTTEAVKPSHEAVPDSFLGNQTQVVEQQRVSARREGETPHPAPKSMPHQSRSQPILSQLGVPLPKLGETKTHVTDSTEDRSSLQAQARGEYVKGFKESDQTLLNTREYVFYGYFQRIREKLDRAWDQALREKLQKYFYRGRQLASDAEYTTQLLVTLDPDGQVVRVRTVGASGTHDLDDAAVKAFNEAGPFPNPPRGLVEAGHIEVRWDFVLRT